MGLLQIQSMEEKLWQSIKANVGNRPYWLLQAENMEKHEKSIYEKVCTFFKIDTKYKQMVYENSDAIY